MTDQDFKDYWRWFASDVYHNTNKYVLPVTPTSTVSLTTLEDFSVHSAGGHLVNTFTQTEPSKIAFEIPLIDGERDMKLTTSFIFTKTAYDNYKLTATIKFTGKHPTKGALDPPNDSGILIGSVYPENILQSRINTWDTNQVYTQLNVVFDSNSLITSPFHMTPDFLQFSLTSIDGSYGAGVVPRDTPMTLEVYATNNKVDAYVTPFGYDRLTLHLGASVRTTAGSIGFQGAGTSWELMNAKLEPLPEDYTQGVQYTPDLTMTGRVLGSKYANTIQVYTGEKTFIEYHDSTGSANHADWDALNSMTSEDAIAWVQANLVVGYEMTWDRVRYVPDVDGMGPGHLFTKETSVPVTGYPDEFTEFLFGQMVVLADGTPYTWDGTMYKTFKSEFWTASERQFYLDFVNTEHLAGKTEAQKAAAAASIQEVVDAVDDAPGTTPARLIWAYTIDAVLDALVEGGEMDWNNLAFHSPYPWPHSVPP